MVKSSINSDELRRKPERKGSRDIGGEEQMRRGGADVGGEEQMREGSNSLGLSKPSAGVS